MTNEGIAPLRVPKELMDRCEAIAIKRRKATGRNVERSEIAREAIRIGLAKLEKGVKSDPPKAEKERMP